MQKLGFTIRRRDLRRESKLAKPTPWKGWPLGPNNSLTAENEQEIPVRAGSHRSATSNCPPEALPRPFRPQAAGPFRSGCFRSCAVVAPRRSSSARRPVPSVVVPALAEERAAEFVVRGYEFFSNPGSGPRAKVERVVVTLVGQERELGDRSLPG